MKIGVVGAHRAYRTETTMILVDTPSEDSNNVKKRDYTCSRPSSAQLGDRSLLETGRVYRGATSFQRSEYPGLGVAAWSAPDFFGFSRMSRNGILEVFTVKEDSTFVPHFDEAVVLPTPGEAAMLLGISSSYPSYFIVTIPSYIERIRPYRLIKGQPSIHRELKSVYKPVFANIQLLTALDVNKHS
ncbi:hypothetical protein CPB85DRAFT_1249071 [Mucidula mucida]|nr:hypothetical protein CPB85DRAFT_1249071 [Mucidula mucida]